MTCSACAAAERAPRTAARENGCQGCVARMLAGTGAHHASELAGKMTPQYRDALKQLFGEGWKAGNESVKAWAAKTTTAMQQAAKAALVVPPKKRKR